MDGIKGILDSKKAFILVVVLGLFASFVFTGRMTVDAYANLVVWPLVIPYFVVESATGITSIIKGKPREAAPVPAAPTPPDLKDKE